MHEWKETFAATNAEGNDETAETKQQEEEAAHVTKEQDILKGRLRISSGMQGEIRLHCLASLAIFGANDQPPLAGSSHRILRLAEEPDEQADQQG